MMSMDQKQAAAEQVRAHLVMVRGGAPFLSPVDSRLLVNWLDEAVPVDVILTAIEVVAARRSKARIKRPLSLNAVKAVVKRGAKKGGSESVRTDSEALDRLIQRLENSETPGMDGVAQKLRGLGGRGLGPSQMLAEALEIARQFHESAWETADQEALLAEAREELGDLAAMLSAERFKTAAEEVARDNLRKRTKLLSATNLSQVFRT